MVNSESTVVSECLKLKRISIDTNYENVVYLHRECSIYRAEGFQALAKIEVFTNGHSIQAAIVA